MRASTQYEFPASLTINAADKEKEGEVIGKLLSDLAFVSDERDVAQQALAKTRAEVHKLRVKTEVKCFCPVSPT